MADLARELGWLKSKVQRIEEGTGFLSVDDLMPLARALKVRAQKLLDAGKVPA
jgi:transcriptional regulator with XRE-family HTH domain